MLHYGSRKINTFNTNLYSHYYDDNHLDIDSF